MVKEKLTIGNIKSDLKYARKQNYSNLVAGAILLVFTVSFAYWFFHIIKSMDYYEFKAYALVACFVLLSFLIIFVSIIYIRSIVKICRILKGDIRIVKAKLVGKHFKERVQRYQGVVKYYYLYFSEYDEYIIPKENYKWSSEYPLGDAGVYYTSDYGDEFYLVLFKEHVGGILLLYNTKMFELKE